MSKKIVNQPNMATTPMLQFIRPPEVYEIGNEIEKFIEETDRFFELTQTAEEHRGLFVKAFLSTEATRKYEIVEGCENYKERLQVSFSKPANLGNDLSAALSYRRGSDSTADFFKKIERFASNIMRHNLKEEDLKIFLIQNALEEQEVKKDLKMQDLKTYEEIKNRITRSDEVRKEIESETVAAIQRPVKTFASAASGRQTWDQGNIFKRYSEGRTNMEYQRNENYTRNGFNQRQQQYNSPQQSQRPLSNQRTQYNGRPQRFERSFRQSYYPNRESRQTSNYISQKKCWACREEGHIRSECPNVKCQNCDKRGHFRHQCYEIQPERRPPNRRNVAAFGEDFEPTITEDDPKDYAPSSGEVMGAIN